jgi:response regulator RpfG family c-di-GMP phosphodiesterase
LRHVPDKIVICVKNQTLLKELAGLAKPYFEVIGCTDPEITAQSIVPSEISIFVTDSVALLRRSREMNPKGHRILVTDFTDLDDIVDGINDKTVHHLVHIPVKTRDFLSALLIIYPAPPVFGFRSRDHHHAIGYWGEKN